MRSAGARRTQPVNDTFRFPAVSSEAPRDTSGYRITEYSVGVNKSLFQDSLSFFSLPGQEKTIQWIIIGDTPLQNFLFKDKQDVN
jgi:hypothetical protein